MTEKMRMILNNNNKQELDKITIMQRCVEEFTNKKYTLVLEHDFKNDQLAVQNNIFYVSAEANIEKTLSMIDEYIVHANIAEALT